MNTWTKRISLSLLVVIIAFVTAACGQKSNQSVKAPAPEPSKKQNNEQPKNEETWKGQADWDKTVETAKKESKIVLSGPASAQWRKVLTSFHDKYPEIIVEYNEGNSRDFWPRLQQERKLNKYLWDLRIGGPDPQVYQAKDDGTLDPVRPELVLPEVTDDSKWLGGLDGLFADKEKKYLAGFMAYAAQMAYANRDFVPKSEFNSIDQLLDPKWKGKIVLQDPRGGAGLGYLAVFVKQYGEQFVRDLLVKQKVVITGDLRQLTEWVVRGKYPIGIGIRNYDLLTFEQQGVKTNVESVEEGPLSMSIGSGGIQLINKRPHPNATKVFMNWLLTAEVQKTLTQETQINSRRLDIPPGDKDTVVDPKHVDKYIAHQEEYMLETRQKATDIANELIK